MSPHELEQALAAHLAAFAIAGVAINSVVAFFGYALWRLILGFNGFLVLGAVGLGVGLATGDAGTMLIASLVGGLLGALLFAGIPALGTFVVGGLWVTMTLGGALTVLGLVRPSGAADELLFLALVLFCVGGVCTVLGRRTAIVWLTGLTGGIGIASAIAALTTGSAVSIATVATQSQQGVVELVAGAMLGVFAAAIQFTTTARASASTSPAVGEVAALR